MCLLGIFVALTVFQTDTEMEELCKAGVFECRTRPFIFALPLAECQLRRDGGNLGQVRRSAETPFFSSSPQIGFAKRAENLLGVHSPLSCEGIILPG